MTRTKKKTTKSKKDFKAAAIITIFNAPNMTKKGRRDIAKWMKRQAKFLIKHNKELSKRFTARYLYNTDFYKKKK